MGKRGRMRAIEPVVEVWLVWDGEYDPTLECICATQAGAEREAHELRKTYGSPRSSLAAKHVSVEGPYIVKP